MDAFDRFFVGGLILEIDLLQIVVSWMCSGCLPQHNRCWSPSLILKSTKAPSKLFQSTASWRSALAPFHSHSLEPKTTVVQNCALDSLQISPKHHPLTLPLLCMNWHHKTHDPKRPCFGDSDLSRDNMSTQIFFQAQQEVRFVLRLSWCFSIWQ